MMNEIIHKPVLLQETLDFVPDNAKLLVDGTLGHGGHSLALLKKYPDLKIIGIDMDQNMMKKAKKRLEKYFDRIEFKLDSYKNIKKILGNQKADFILLDIGVNLEHFKDGERGFSFQYNAPLDMRFDQKQKLSAAEIVNKYSHEELERVLSEYAEFRQPKLGEIVSKICEVRRKSMINTTDDLKKILQDCGLGKNPMAVIFQALRIEVNGELDNLKQFLRGFPECLAEGGRCAVMSYHSLEDRMVKYAFKELVDDGEFELVNKKVVMPNYKEVEKNKAARSAKLRVIELKI